MQVYTWMRTPRVYTLVLFIVHCKQHLSVTESHLAMDIYHLSFIISLLQNFITVIMFVHYVC